MLILTSILFEIQCLTSYTEVTVWLAFSWTVQWGDPLVLVVVNSKMFSLVMSPQDADGSMTDLLTPFTVHKMVNKEWTGSESCVGAQ